MRFFRTFLASCLLQAAAPLAWAQEPITVVVVNASGVPNVASDVARTLEAGGFRTAKSLTAKSTRAVSLVVCEPSAQNGARSVATALGIADQPMVRDAVKLGPIVVYVGTDWKKPDVVEKAATAQMAPEHMSLPKVRKKPRPWTAGFTFAWVPFGRLWKNNLGDETVFAESMDMGSEFHLERKVTRWLGAGLSLGGLWGFHVSTRDPDVENTDTSIGEPITLSPFARILLRLSGSMAATAGIRVGAAFFRSAVAEDPHALGYSGGLLAGLAWSGKRWQATAEALFQGVRVHPHLINTWLVIHPQLRAGIGFRF